MSDEKWMTYAEAADALGVSPEAIRQRAIRQKWARRQGNDGLARVRLPDEHPRSNGKRERANKPPEQTPSDPRLGLEIKIATLEAEIAGLREMLAKADRTAEHWRDHAAELVKAMPAPTPPASRLSFWRRLVA